MNNTTEHAKKAGSFITDLLTGWGLPATWAKVIAGALVGAALAALACTSNSCTLSYSQAVQPDGSATTQYESTVDPVPLKALLSEDCGK